MTAVLPSRSDTSLAICLLIILFGFAIRVHNLAGDSLWLDELLTLNSSDKGLAMMVSQNDHPPLFYALTSLFISIFGVNEFGARLPSLFAGTIAPALLILLGKLLHRQQAGMWAALLLVLSPFHLRYSQEARHYAVLMALAIATFISLYLAWQRPTWPRWLLYTLITLITIYLHYGGLLILLSQSCWIAICLILQWRKRQWQTVPYVAAAAITIFLLYLPWLPRLQLALGRNVGADIVAANRGYTPFSTWLRNGLYEFGTSTGILPYIFLLLCVLGLAWLLWQQHFDSAGIILTGILPCLFIPIFQIAREPLPRYIIYVYPFYLLAIGTAIAALVLNLRRQFWWLSWVLALGIILLFAPLLQDEYTFIQHDWRGIYDKLAQSASPNDVIIGFTMNYPGHFNIVVHSSPYHLQQAGRNYTFLPGNDLTFASVTPLAAMDTAVWGIVMNWKEPMPVNDASLEIYPFQHNLYLVHQSVPIGFNALDRTIALYQKLISLANKPTPFCELHRDLANLYAVKQDYNNANKALQIAVRQCPYLGQGDLASLLPTNTIAYGLLDQSLAAGRTDEARQWATVILQQLNPTYDIALETLTTANLLQQFKADQVIIQENNSPEPVRLDRFLMPQDGDSGEVIFNHPPATISFPLELPTDPVALYFRMALAPRSWLWGGDGVTFLITAQQGDQAPIEIFRQQVGNTLADHKWHVGTVSLAKYAGQAVTLTLTTDAGPAGDNSGDWAGWDTPRLIWEASPP